MRNVTQETITQVFLDYCGPETSPRLRFLLEHMASHLNDFVRETKLSHNEGRKAIERVANLGGLRTCISSSWRRDTGRW